MKKYQYLASWDDQTLTRVGGPVVVLGDSNVSQVEVTLPSNFLLDPTGAVARMYFLLPGEKESSFETLETATKDENGDSHVTWTIKHVHSQKGGRLAFSLTLIGDDAQWDSRTAIIPVYESRYQPESEEAEEPYTGRLTALEGSMAAIRGEFAEVQDDFEELKETATLGTPIPESLVANMQAGHVYIYTGTEPGYTVGHVYYYVDGVLKDGGVYGGTAVDATLTQSGQAADAAAVGAEVSAIKEDLSAISETMDETIILDNTSFDRATNNTTFSYDAATNTTTVTNATESRYRCANTPLSFLYGKLIPGETYILSGQATAISGNPVLRISIRGTESGVDSAAVSLDLTSGVSGEVSFTATEYMRYVSLFVTYDNTNLSSAAYKDVYIKSEAEGVTAVDVIAREGIKDIREQISTLDITNQWAGKVWYAYGTSITHNTVASGKYVGYLSEMGGFAEAVRKGIPGQGIGNLGDYSTGQVYDAICNTTDGKLTADLITLETGANDLGHVTVPLGTVYDTGKTTLAGCLNDCLRYLQANTDAQVVVFFSPATTFTPTANYQFYDWQEMVRRICDINRVHYINVNCNLGYGKLTSGKGSLYVKDSIHQTDLGAYIYAENIWMQLRNVPVFRTTLPA